MAPPPPPQQKQTVLPGDAEQQVRKTLSRQHARDISEYTRQLHSKDREIESLKKQLAKVRATDELLRILFLLCLHLQLPGGSFVPE